MLAPIHIFQPPADNELTGGYIYNRRIADELAGAAARSVPAAALPDALAKSRREGASALVDSLFIKAGFDIGALAGHRITALIHHLPSLDPGFPDGERETQEGRERGFIEAASRVVVTSEFMRQLLTARDVAVPIVACPPGVDDAFFGVEPEETTPADVVTVANLEPRKGYLEVVAPLAEVARAHPFSWHIVGDDHGDPAYARRVREAIDAAGLGDRVTWHGRLERSALLELLSRACAHLLPTRFETYGMVVAESLAAAVPMIAPRIGEIQHLVRDGETGLLAEPGAPRELASALERILADPRLRAGMRDALRRGRPRIPRWSEAARVVADNLAETAR